MTGPPTPPPTGAMELQDATRSTVSPLLTLLGFKPVLIVFCRYIHRAHPKSNVTNGVTGTEAILL